MAKKIDNRIELGEKYLAADKATRAIVQDFEKDSKTLSLYAAIDAGEVKNKAEIASKAKSKAGGTRQVTIKRLNSLSDSTKKEILALVKNEKLEKDEFYISFITRDKKTIKSVSICQRKVKSKK